MENEGTQPNRMETRFLGIAYRKFTEGIGPPVCDLTNELYPTCAGIGLAWIAPPAGASDATTGGDVHGETEFHKPNLLIPSPIRFRVSSYRTATGKPPIFRIFLRRTRVSLSDLFFFFASFFVNARSGKLFVKFISRNVSEIKEFRCYRSFAK